MKMRWKVARAKGNDADARTRRTEERIIMMIIFCIKSDNSN
jgi:hypothetical protein